MLAVYMRSRVKRMQRIQDLANNPSLQATLSTPPTQAHPSPPPRYVPRESFLAMKTLEHPQGKKITRIKLA